jgi:hypothetical protein
VKLTIVRRAKDLVLDSLDEDFAEGFQLLGPLLDGVKSLNPGTVTRVEKDGQQRFKRLFVMLGQHVEVSQDLIERSFLLAYEHVLIATIGQGYTVAAPSSLHSLGTRATY